MNSSSFFAKILLFGEYGIIKNSKGISIPFNNYSGSLKIDKSSNENIKLSNKQIKSFYDFLKLKFDKDEFNFKTFKSDIDDGLYFKSSIPLGYGVGSSGALVAAIYDKYFLKKIKREKKIDTENIIVLKNIFSKMESFFHGESSGLDPVNSYLSSPILIKSKNDIETTSIPKQKENGNKGFFLLDSGVSSNTRLLVNKFLESIKNNEFEQLFQNEFVEFTNSCVDDFLNSNFNSLEKNIKKLSEFTYYNLKNMIPNHIESTWKEGLKSKDYFLKLCGSGGGGYIIGFSFDLLKANNQLKDYNFQVLISY
jgi:mevalonate kinase